jgi:uncharacterized protein
VAERLCREADRDGPAGMSVVVVTDLSPDGERLRDICARFRVARLEVFGSFARGDAGVASDVDILVTFKSEARIGLEFIALKMELENLFGRSVDLLTCSSVERSPNKYFRHFTLAHTAPLYESA